MILVIGNEPLYVYNLLMGKLILMRHGQSVWNGKNIFTGWVDIPLSTSGIAESLNGGGKIKDLPLDIIYTSTLIRAIMTAMLVMSVHTSGKVAVISHEEEGKLGEWGYYAKEREKECIPVFCAWQLNERMYGDLQGCNKEAIKKKYGEDQFKLWRRSYAVPPPNGESLEMTAGRTLPYFNTEILPKLKEGKNILIAAHGNSLRSIMMELDHLSQEEVINLELETGLPVIYNFQGEAYSKQ